MQDQPLQAFTMRQYTDEEYIVDVYLPNSPDFPGTTRYFATEGYAEAYARSVEGTNTGAMARVYRVSRVS